MQVNRHHTFFHGSFALELDMDFSLCSLPAFSDFPHVFIEGLRRRSTLAWLGFESAEGPLPHNTTWAHRPAQARESASVGRGFEWRVMGGELCMDGALLGSVGDGQRFAQGSHWAIRR